MRRPPRRRFRYERRPPWAREEGFGDIKPRGPLLRGRQLNPRLQRELRRANHLLAIGDHINAGHIFNELAQHARDRDLIFPAPMLFMQAAHAYRMGEDYERSLLNARLGLDLLAAQERWRALRFETQHYCEELESAGKNDEAQELHKWLLGKATGIELTQEAQSDTEEAKMLPEKCPYCGAAMSLEQINAGGGNAAECKYCGSVVLPRYQE